MYSMDAFMEFERELAKKRRAEQPPQAPKTLRLEPPVKPQDDDCCNLNCPNCVLLVYQEQLMEYEDSVRWSEMGDQATLPPPSPVDTILTMAETTSLETLDVAYLPRDVALLPVRINTELGSPRVRHIEVDIRTPYETADNLVVHMRNADSAVAACATRLSVSLDTVLRVDACANLPPTYLGAWTTVATLLTWAVDLTSPLRPRHLRLLAAYAGNAADQAAVLALAQAWANDGDAPNVVDLLSQFASMSLSLDALLAVAPSLPARQYTIASSAAAQPSTLAVAVSLKSRGRCAMYMAAASSHLFGYVKRSGFSEQLHSNAPLLCIGTGTGIAPFRAIAQERLHDSITRKWPPMVLFHGSQRRDMDWLYHAELEAAATTGVLAGYYPVFSRDPSTEKQYVQDALVARASLVAKALVDDKATVCVCGSLAMGRDVKHALVACLVAANGWTDDAAKAFISRLQDDGKYIAEVW
ncbi:hypothetical protein SPRG_00328 [Saprolegnia parasitica CBS 223.65]|uniref:NADPH--hemoprotein reductase n=1 Tax=Saprolegnia parasitica (strain CBS 223.65) TaxID=695850 RepID=A0A067DA06_SAPPC|nr:hypothetical protein SPRG_00328 [Saprolegnia parasitica CBS 223.65]KDO35481.1 hypothetical protein SPRG_00328 [Saprolegnia parasitica CBS 223.65]|eukprot:XP_012193818.1 hypothetical protein SPRG_00328 [Saprolegnia parasitica CBS 223.65]